jgi:hypothetical protein
MILLIKTLHLSDSSLKYRCRKNATISILCSRNAIVVLREFNRHLNE